MTSASRTTIDDIMGNYDSNVTRKIMPLIGNLEKFSRRGDYQGISILAEMVSKEATAINLPEQDRDLIGSYCDYLVDSSRRRAAKNAIAVWLYNLKEYRKIGEHPGAELCKHKIYSALKKIGMPEQYVDSVESYVEPIVDSTRRKDAAEAVRSYLHFIRQFSETGNPYAGKLSERMISDISWLGMPTKFVDAVKRYTAGLVEALPETEQVQ